MNICRLVVVLTISVSCINGADWPNWRGPNFDGVSVEKVPEKLPEALEVIWKAKVGIGFSSFSVVGNRVLTMGNSEGKDTVRCLNADSGEVIWQHSYACELDPLYYEGGPGGTPTVHERAVYTLSKKGHAFCLSLDSGKVIWSRDLVKDHELKLPEWSFACSAFVDGDKILLNAGRYGIALARDTGKTLWVPDTESSGYATIVPFDDSYLFFSAKALLALDNSGAVKWKYPWKSSRDVNAADTVLVGNDIVVSSSAGTKRLRVNENRLPPDVVWHQRDLKWYFNAGVLVRSHIFSLHGTTHRPTELVCTNAATGETVWSEDGFGSGGLIAAGDHIILCDQGVLTIFKASEDSYQPVLQQKVLDGKCWTSPVLANGRIFCRNASGDVVALSLPLR